MRCPFGYVHPPGSLSCYRAEGSTSYTWTTANNACSGGGKLATFASQVDLDYVVSNFCGASAAVAASGQKTMWVGMRDTHNYGTTPGHVWEWQSGALVTASQLASQDGYWGNGGAAANPDSHHSCVTISTVGSPAHLQATDCNTPLGVLRCCQYGAL